MSCSINSSIKATETPTYLYLRGHIMVFVSHRPPPSHSLPSIDWIGAGRRYEESRHAPTIGTSNDHWILINAALMVYNISFVEPESVIVWCYGGGGGRWGGVDY